MLIGAVSVHRITCYRIALSKPHYKVKTMPSSYWSFANDEWFKDVGQKRLLISGYRPELVKVEPPLTVNGAKLMDIGSIRIALYKGEISYFDIYKIKMGIKDGRWSIKKPNELQITKADGIFALFITPLRDESNPVLKSALNNIEAVASLSPILFGSHLIYEHVFDNIYSIDSAGRETISSFSGVIKNVYPFGDLPVNSDLLEDYATIAHEFNSLSSERKSRFATSLRWHYKGLREVNSADEFLCYWIALETIAMPDTTNIRPIADTLAQIYGNPEKEIINKLSIGRLYDLRCRIVHKGYRGGIHSDIVDCLRNISLDILQLEIGMMVQKSCIQYLTGKNNIEALLVNAI